MVLLRHGGEHFPNLMVNLNNLRKEGSLCDIDIVIGDTRIRAHKCVLAAGSDYFKSLFCGPMKQNVSEVDLTTVIDDIESVTAVIDFLYTGDINIDNENLGLVLKLSSFLVMDMLRGMCIDYMEANQDLDNCIQFYLLASEFMVPKFNQIFAKAVSSRFGDYLIFSDCSLKVSPNQLKYLVDSCNVFDYCSDLDIILFIIDWVADSKTEEHELVGCEVIDAVNVKTVQHKSKLNLEQNISNLKEKNRTQVQANIWMSSIS